MPAIWSFAGGIMPLPAGYQGSSQMVTGSTESPIVWLDCLEGETIINGVISTIWDFQPISFISSTVDSISPALPSGITAIPGGTGIAVTGLSVKPTDPLSIDYTLKQNELPNQGHTTSASIPPNSVLTKFVPESTKYVDYTITVTVQWLYNNTTPTVGVDTKSWVLRIWNSWISEKNVILSLTE